MKIFACLAVVITCLVVPMWGAKVLLHPANINSHYVYFSRLAAALSQEGHDVFFLAASNAKIPQWLPSSLEIITYKVSQDVPFFNSPECSALMVEAAFVESTLDQLNIWTKMDKEMTQGMFDECHSLHQNEKLINTLKKEDFDFMIVDPVEFMCCYVLPYRLGVPYASFSIPFTTWEYRVPSLPSFVPNSMTEATDHMTFIERLHNAFMDVATIMFSINTDEFFQTYVPEKPTVRPKDLQWQSSLYFYLTETSVYYPAPSMPNTLNIGGIMARPSEPLSSELQKYMDNSPEGVILVSFGSFVDYIPSNITCRIAEAFSKLRQKIIWRIKEPGALPCEIPNNVKTMSWIPQNDLLGHRNIKLFISHCGFNSFIEAVYHAVPILAFPITLDQPFQGRLIQDRGYGLRVDIRDFTQQQLVDSANQVITNETYKQNIQKASAILKHKPMSASKRASFWIDHVVKYGDSHLRTAAYELSHIQFFMVDLVLFVIAAVVVSSLILMCICRYFFRYCVYCLCKKKSSKVKPE